MTQTLPLSPVEPLSKESPQCKDGTRGAARPTRTQMKKACGAAAPPPFFLIELYVSIWYVIIVVYLFVYIIVNLIIV